MTIQAVRIDPAKLEGLSETVSSEVLGTADGSFAHDEDWVDRVSEQICVHRFAAINLPQAWSRVYRTLLQAETYPPRVNDRETVLEGSETVLRDSQVLPAELLQLSSDWSQMCEQACKHVARSLLRLTSPPARAAQGVHHQVHGMLRISYNSDAGPHFDNAFVTMMGTGTVRGALQLLLPKPSTECEGDGEDQYVPCEELLEDCSDAEAGAVPFLMFAGVRVASPFQKECKPLFHRVAYKSGQDGVDRINAIYFIRNYGISDADTGQTELEIQAFNKTVLTHREFIKHGVHHAEEDAAKEESSRLEHSTDVPSTSSSLQAGEDSDGNELFDWSSAGLFGEA